MVCPKCSGKSRVIDVRFNANENETYRQHICTECDNKFYTVEFTAEENNSFKEQWRSSKR